MSAFRGEADAYQRPRVSEKLMKSALAFIGYFLLAMGLFWAGVRART